MQALAISIDGKVPPADQLRTAHWSRETILRHAGRSDAGGAARINGPQAIRSRSRGGGLFRKNLIDHFLVNRCAHGWTRCLSRQNGVNRAELREPDLHLHETLSDEVVEIT